MSIRLSCVMIVRDSSRTLPAALESIRPWVDELVVVDTGSTDDTPEIAKHYGARLFHFPWCDDFAAARNESIRHAQGDWVFWMDSDDTISQENGRKLRELANRPLEETPMAYVMQVHCPGSDDSGDRDVTVVDHVKMFRNRPELRFECRIHEQILPAIRRLDGEVAWTDVFVVHSGSDQTPAGRKQKHIRDLRLLELELQDRPEHPFALFNLGMTYADMGSHQQAVDALRRSAAVSQPSESHVRKIYALLVSSLTQLSRYEDAQEACQEGLSHYPEDAELQFRQGIVAQHLGQHQQAINSYRAALCCSEPRHFASVDPGITGFKARHNLALVYTETRQLDLAEIQWRAIVRERPDYRPGWQGLGENLLQQKKLIAAEVELEKLVDISSLGCEAALWRAQLAKERRQLAQVTEELHSATRDYPNDLPLLRFRCQFLFEHGSLEEAQQALLALGVQEPEDGATQHNLGIVYLRLGKVQEARNAFRTSLTLRPDAPQTYLQLAETLTTLGDHQEAAQVRTRASEITSHLQVANHSVAAATVSCNVRL